MIDLSALPDPMRIEVRRHTALDVAVGVPGSKSITNRALVCAALADGTSTLLGALDADDTAAMRSVLAAIGIQVQVDDDRWMIAGCNGYPRVDGVHVDVRQSGTTARFALPLLALGTGQLTIDAHPQMRGRPMGPTWQALRACGADPTTAPSPSGFPAGLQVSGLPGGELLLAADTSSQFLSGLLLAAPCARGPMRIVVSTDLVSEPYIEMTIAVMRAFGAEVGRPDARTFVVAPTGYRACDFAIEPDASAASYPWAAAMIVGGAVTVEGLGTASIQGDVAIVDVFEQMGAAVERAPHRVTVRRDGRLRGVRVDLRDLSDMVPTLAVVAAFADSTTTIDGVGFIRAKESDRIGGVADELRKLGVEAHALGDGLTITPGSLRGAEIETYADHRMAMAFALAGLRIEGVAIRDPSCVAKTYPGYWAMLDTLR